MKTKYDFKHEGDLSIKYAVASIYGKKLKIKPFSEIHSFGLFHYYYITAKNSTHLFARS